MMYKLFYYICNVVAEYLLKINKEFFYCWVSTGKTLLFEWGPSTTLTIQNTKVSRRNSASKTLKPTTCGRNREQVRGCCRTLSSKTFCHRSGKDTTIFSPSCPCSKPLLQITTIECTRTKRDGVRSRGKPASGKIKILPVKSHRWFDTNNSLCP